MAEDFVNEARYQAGLRYISSIEKLGFGIDYALWTLSADSADRGDVQLSIVSGMIEVAGTHAVYELLFKAFDKAATPAEIDPWIVSLYGSGTEFASHITTVPLIRDSGFMTLKTADGLVNQETPMWIQIVDRLTRPNWIYKLKHFEKDASGDLWAYERFRRNVEALAA